MGTFLELLGAIGQLFLSFTKEVNEEEIEKNITYLKRYEWFNDYLSNNKYQALIEKNTDVRYVIGKCNVTKMKKHKYRLFVQKRINRELLKGEKQESSFPSI